VRCRDVNTMKAMISAFSRDFLSRPLQRILQLASFPHRRVSVGVDCHPLDENELSTFDLPLAILPLLCCIAAESRLRLRFASLGGMN
jgi:hypothetical protein